MDDETIEETQRVARKFGYLLEGIRTGNGDWHITWTFYNRIGRSKSISPVFASPEDACNWMMNKWRLLIPQMQAVVDAISE